MGAESHPEGWVKHSDTSGCVCWWCRHGEEHHDVGRRQRALINTMWIVLLRCQLELPHNPSLVGDIERELRKGDEWQR